MKYSKNNCHTVNKKPLLSLLFITLFSSLFLQAKTIPDGYMIAANQSIKRDKEWAQVVMQLQRLHPKAEVVYYEALEDILPTLKKKLPRYLCVVERPEALDSKFVIAGNRMCRNIDNDIYDDYIWGIVSGYSAADALRMVQQSAQPYTLKTALSTTSEVKRAVWFDKFAGISDGAKNEWYEKKSSTDSVHTYKMDKQYRSLGIFMEKWKTIDPDVILTSSHATQYNLEMPFSSGNLRPNNGQLYADFFNPQNVPGTSHPRVYLPIGNCLIGDFDRTRKSMAPAWLSSGGATAMLGYVVTTWYGRNGWGALKFLLAAPGKHTVSEAAFLNRQDMYTHELQRNTDFLQIVPDFTSADENTVAKYIGMEIEKLTGKQADKDDVGFVYDRDVVAYYGDPAWNVRTQNVAGEADYEITAMKKGVRTIITLKTGSHFSVDKVSGKGFKEEHVKDIPLAYFLPERIQSPKIVENEKRLNVVIDENFLLIYNKDLAPQSEYRLVVE